MRVVWALLSAGQGAWCLKRPAQQRVSGLRHCAVVALRGGGDDGGDDDVALSLRGGGDSDVVAKKSKKEVAGDVALRLRGGSDVVAKKSKKEINVALGLRGGGGGSEVVAKKSKKEVNVARRFQSSPEASWVDSTIHFLEAPMTDLSLGVVAASLTILELSREVSRLGVKGANWALLVLSLARCLKSALAVLRSTKQALRGYKAYSLIQRGDNVFLRHIPDIEGPAPDEKVLA